MGIFGLGKETYLYVNGIAPKKELCLTPNITLLPTSNKLSLDIVSKLLENDIDFAIAILNNQFISSQLKITASDSESLAIAAWNSQWDCLLLGAIFKCNAMCNIQSSKSIETVDLSTYMHITNYAMRSLFEERYYLTEDDEVWIGEHYSKARLLLENEKYSIAVHSMATYRWHSIPRIQLAIIWAGIEALFDVSSELNFRISLYAAKFLSQEKESVKELFDNIKKLYNARSAAVHGAKIKGNVNELVEQSAELLNRLIRQCAIINSLPETEKLLFDC